MAVRATGKVKEPSRFMSLPGLGLWEFVVKSLASVRVYLSLPNPTFFVGSCYEPCANIYTFGVFGFGVAH